MVSTFSQELNTTGEGNRTSAVYDSNIAQWLMHTGNCVLTPGGLWVFQKGDANGNAVAVGAAADDAAAAGNPLLIAGKYNATPATRQDGDAVTLQTSATGSLRTELTGSNFEQTPGSAVPNKTIYVGGKKSDGNLQGLTLIAAGSNPADAEQILGISSLFATGPSWYREAGLSGIIDASAGANSNASGLLVYNGSTYDRWRNNIKGTLLASAARIGSQDSPLQQNYNHKGVLVCLDITASSGTGGLSLTVSTSIPQNGSYPWWLHVAFPVVSAVGAYFYMLYPGDIVASGNINGVAKAALPREWGVRINHSDATSYTYSVGYFLIL